jgi:hypothetical protein
VKLKLKKFLGYRPCNFLNFEVMIVNPLIMKEISKISPNLFVVIENCKWGLKKRKKKKKRAHVWGL